MNQQYTIGVKSKHATGANIVKYDGKCYYRVPGTGGTTSTSPSSVEVFYPPCDTLTPSLTTKELSSGSCNYGEQNLLVNEVLTVPDDKIWFQFRFHGVNTGDLSIIKFIKPGGIGYFTKNIQIIGNDIVFDLGGAAEYKFPKGNLRTAHQFSAYNSTYCMVYAAAGSSIFVIDVLPGVVVSSPLNPSLTPTPTPTPTNVSSTGAPNGNVYNSTVVWASSGTDMLSMWYDSTQLSTLSDGTGNEPSHNTKVAGWLDRSIEASPGTTAYDLSNTQPAGQPKYLSIGNGIRGGPSLKFTQDFSVSSSYLKYNSAGVGLDHRAVFIVADTTMIRGNQIQALISGLTKGGGANSAYGNMLGVEFMMNHWVGVPIGNQPRQSIYSNTYNGGDGGQYYTNASPVPDNHPQVPAATGAIYSGIRSAGPAYIQGLSVGGYLGLADAIAAGWDGKIGEIIILNDEPSLKLQQEIEGYLAWKWGLVEFLPNNHPWKNGIPQPPPPTPVPPTPTPVPTSPPVPVPVIPTGVNVVTTTQYYDVVSQRNKPSTLWLGGNYQTEWDEIIRRLDTVTSTNTLQVTIVNGITSTIDQMSLPRSINPTGTWKAHALETTDFDCPGGHNHTIRAGWDKDQVDNVDSRLMYCLGNIESGSATYQNQTLHSILPLQDWVDFSNATSQPTSSNIRKVESSLGHYLRIDSAGFSYNTVDATLPLTTLYSIPADPTISHPLDVHTSPLQLDDSFTRVDIATELMYYPDGVIFFQAPIQIGDNTTLEITVKVPGINSDSTGFTNTTDLVWDVGVEIVDKAAKQAVYDSVVTNLTDIPQSSIPSNYPSINITGLDSHTYKITPYYGKWFGSTSQDIVNSVETGKLPVIFVRIDRVIV